MSPLSSAALEMEALYSDTCICIIRGELWKPNASSYLFRLSCLHSGVHLLMQYLLSPTARESLRLIVAKIRRRAMHYAIAPMPDRVCLVVAARPRNRATIIVSVSLITK